MKDSTYMEYKRGIGMILRTATVALSRHYGNVRFTCCVEAALLNSAARVSPLGGHVFFPTPEYHLNESLMSYSLLLIVLEGTIPPTQSLLMQFSSTKHHITLKNMPQKQISERQKFEVCCLRV